MIKFSEEQMINAQNEAYLKAGHNAYFGNGFNAGVKFVLDALKNMESSSRIIDRPQLEERTAVCSCGRQIPSDWKQCDDCGKKIITQEDITDKWWE